jgi:two-component system sensor histidine kinase BaeS
MAEPERSSALRRRLVAAFMTVALISLGVLFIGTVVPHLPDQHVDPHDPVSLVWLLAATALAAVTAIGLSVGIAGRLTRPVDGYIETARRFAAGDHSARPADLGPPEFAELASALVAAADEIERSETARRQLTADIAHELRTPLAALQAGLEELRDGLVPADAEALAALHTQATRLGRIVNDLSDLAAAESSQLHTTLDEIDLAAVAEFALAAHAGAMKSAGLLVGRELQPETWVIADVGRMHQVVGNLLANAVLYCRPGDQVTVRVWAAGTVGVLEVADNGPGFRADELPHIFNRAWRGVSADGTRGSGLGLPIVQALMTAQHGTVSVDSAEGKGARISVSLPLAVSHGARLGGLKSR